jgi:hypothetical protein
MRIDNILVGIMVIYKSKKSKVGKIDNQEIIIEHDPEVSDEMMAVISKFIKSGNLPPIIKEKMLCGETFQLPFFAIRRYGPGPDDWVVLEKGMIDFNRTE